MKRWLAPLSLLLAVGCGPTMGTVSGTVTFNGAPVPDGTVSLLSGGKVYQGEIRDGRYEIAGIPPGVVAVTVVRLDPNQPDPYEALNKARKEMLEKKVADPKLIDPKVVTDAAKLDALTKKRHLVPAAYARPETSGLRFTVAAGANTFPIELKGKP